MKLQRVLLGLPSLGPKLVFLGLLASLAGVRALGLQGARIGPFVPDLGIGWMLFSCAVALFILPPSVSRLRRVIGAALALGVLFSFSAWLEARTAEAPPKQVSAYPGLDTSADPERSTSLSSFLISNRRQLDRLSGRRRYVALEVTGYVFVPESGSHRFRARCDDGCSLRIGGELVLGGAGSASGEVRLARGPHRFWLGYEQRTGPALLKLEWERPAFVELLPLDFFVSDRVDLLTAEARRRHALTSILLSIAQIAWWLCILSLVAWIGARARGYWLYGPRLDRQSLADGFRAGLKALRASAVYLVASVLMVAHGYWVVTLLGTKPLLDGWMIIQDDYSHHLANAIRAREFFFESGRLWGYSPTLMAGFPNPSCAKIKKSTPGLFPIME